MTTIVIAIVLVFLSYNMCCCEESKHGVEWILKKIWEETLSAEQTEMTTSIGAQLPEIIARRIRRSMTVQRRHCNQATPCCKDMLTINFTSIGWDSQILFPHIMEIDICRGTCMDTTNLSYHSKVLDALYQKHLMKKNKLPCCRATKLENQSIFVRTKNGVQVRHVNIRAKKCGCT